MTNDESPYTPPSSGVTGQVPVGRRLGWKTYLWLLVAASALVFPVLGFGWMQLLDWMDLALTAVGMIGLFGFAYRRPVGSGAFWRRWLPFQLLWDAAIVLFIIPAGLAYQIPGEEPSSAVENIVSFALLIPLYIALYRYGYRSPEIWSRDARLTV